MKKYTDPEERFAFGKNWQGFIEAKFTPERLEAASRDMLGALHLGSLRGKSFLDIGSGSGLHSLAALRAGAKRIVSFDYDPVSVETTRLLRKRAGAPEHWSVLSGSVLDATFMRSLEPADIVYSWGVLHHTGHVWAALENARIPLAQNGVFFIALYSVSTAQAITLGGDPGPDEWLRLKHEYMKAGSWQRPLLEAGCVWKKYLAAHCGSPGRLWLAVRALSRKIRAYKEESRGMDFWTDVKDWIGGWPMEYVRERDCLVFCRDRLGLEPLWMKTGRGNTEYIFRPRGAQNYWEPILCSRKQHVLTPPFRHVGGHMWRASLPEAAGPPDTPDYPQQSRLVLYEEALPLDYAHAFVNAVQAFGLGRYRHCKEELLFSASDNTDPNTNTRIYTAYC